MAVGLRIVTFNIITYAYSLLAQWASERGHTIVLVVTSPAGTVERYGSTYLQLVEAVPAAQDVLITTRMRKTALPVITALAPDLIISATFPQRIPAELAAVPRYGALNLHPAPLPRGRGPNPPRLIYEGDATTGVTAHRLAPEFDAGLILSRQERALPEHVDPETIFGIWRELLLAALDEAVSRAAAGEAGEPQDEALATYAAPFREEEYWLDWSRPAALLQRQVAALNLGAPSARARLGGEDITIRRLRLLPDPALPVPPGTVLERDGDRVVMRAGDGLVEVEAEVGGRERQEGE